MVTCVERPPLYKDPQWWEVCTLIHLSIKAKKLWPEGDHYRQAPQQKRILFANPYTVSWLLNMALPWNLESLKPYVYRDIICQIWEFIKATRPLFAEPVLCLARRNFKNNCQFYSSLWVVVKSAWFRHHKQETQWDLVHYILVDFNDSSMWYTHTITHTKI